MTASRDVVIVYKDQGNAWTWHRISTGNHAIVGMAGEGFSRRAAARRAAARANPGVPVQATGWVGR